MIVIPGLGPVFISVNKQSKMRADPIDTVQL